MQRGPRIRGPLKSSTSNLWKLNVLTHGEGKSGCRWSWGWLINWLQDKEINLHFWYNHESILAKKSKAEGESQRKIWLWKMAQAEKVLLALRMEGEETIDKGMWVVFEVTRTWKLNLLQSLHRRRETCQYFEFSPRKSCVKMSHPKL